MSLVRAGRPDEAAQVLEEAVREKPTDPLLRAALFEAYEAKGDFEALAKGVKGAPKSFEGTADHAFYEGRLAELDRKTAEAVAAYERALSIQPEHRGALFRLAKELDLRGMDEEALALYERLAALRPVDAAALLNLGILYEDMGSYDRALGCFEAVLKVDPAHERARLFRDDAAASLSMYYDEDEEKKEDKLQQLLRTPISDFELSVRARNCLQKMEIQSLGDLVRKTEAELLAYKNFGETSLSEIRELLTAKGLRLGMLRDQIEAEAIARMEAEAAAHSLEIEDEATLARREAEEAAEEERADALARPIADLPLSPRARRALEGIELQSIGDLASKTAEELSKLPNFSPAALEEVREKLQALGLDLAG
jgi:DNA-directed RNA polymerase subunit alpha